MGTTPPSWYPDPDDRHDRHEQQGRRLATASGVWVKQHKIISVVVLLFLLGSCGAILDLPEDSEGDRPSASDPVTLASPTETSEADATDELPAPTPQDVWRDAYTTNKSAYLLAVAAALGVDSLAGDSGDFAVGTCTVLSKGRALDKRVGRVSQQPSARQAREDREEQRRLEEEREEEPAPPSSVYYENCSAVEAAGAAPICAGDPGYSRDLDRDGDGVACEQ